jgi:amino acid transporter
VIGSVLYGMIIVLYLVVRKRLGRQENAFDLGRFEMPIAIGALVWSLVVVFILVSPPEALTAVLISLGILLIGGVYFVYLLAAKREVLETTPGQTDVFKQ